MEAIFGTQQVLPGAAFAWERTIGLQWLRVCRILSCYVSKWEVR
jgi:hypothetical protein